MCSSHRFDRLPGALSSMHAECTERVLHCRYDKINKHEIRRQQRIDMMCEGLAEAIMEQMGELPDTIGEIWPVEEHGEFHAEGNER